MLRLTRASAIKARSQAKLQIKTLLVLAPSELCEPIGNLPRRRRVAACAQLTPCCGHAAHATVTALRTLAARCQTLDAELAAFDLELRRLVSAAAPRLLDQPGIGPENAARLLVLAGDNAERLRSEAALAALCGVSPVEASSGRIRRHRLNRGGDRQGNCALRLIANNRMLHHPETRDYVARRTTEGLSRKEMRLCLMWHLVRRLYPLLLADLADAAKLGLT